MTAPQPAGPATADAVAGWLGIAENNDTERQHIADVVPAVNAWVATFHTPDDNGKWPAHVTRGAVMLAARITRRRNSPAGVEAFTELGPTYVSRYDPDIDKMLGLGGYRPIVVG